VAIRPAGKNKYGNILWICKCDCGNEHIVPSGKLIQGKSKSCGCYAREIHVNELERHGITTGGSPRTLIIWNGMKARCLNSNAISYKNYGGRGIKICDEWLSFENFHNWAMSNGYADGLEIDRIDNEKGYCPENCRWVSKTFNRKHQRKTRYLEIFGIKLNISEWCEEVKMSKSTAYKYLHISEDTFINEVKKRIKDGRGQLYFVNKFLGQEDAS
jgi:hypothetical protein